MRRPCTAKRKNGEPCRGAAMIGGDKCRMHAGRRSADIRLEAEAKRQLARMDVPAVDDPLSELARITGQVIAWKDAIAATVNELTSLRYENENGGEQLRAEVGLLERAFDRCEKFLTAMARLNIDERLAAISEQRAELIITMLSAALERTVPEHADAVLTAFDEEFARTAGVSL